MTPGSSTSARPGPPLRSSRRVALTALLAAGLCAGVVGFPWIAHPAQAANVSFDLYGTFFGGWSHTSGMEVNPGPTIDVGIGESVAIHMISEDGAPHGLFIDFNDDGHIEPATDYSSPTGLEDNFTFTVPSSPGPHYYYCSIHSPSADGHYAPPTSMWGMFRVIANPSAAFAAPSAATSWTGGVPHDVVFDLIDQDPPTTLTVWVNYSYAGGASAGAIVGPIPGTANPNVVSWTPTGFTAGDVRISVAARDTRGAVGTTWSSPFEVDSVPPTIAVRNPAPNAGGVPTNTQIGVGWSEGMRTAATGAPDAFAVQRTTDGAWVSGTVTWTPDGSRMTFAPAAFLDPTTAYRVLVNGTARDDSDPGNRIAGPDTWQFTTGTGSDTMPPSIQGLAATPASAMAGGYVAIRADVTDDLAVVSVSAHVLGPGFDANLTMVPAGGTAWIANRTYASPGAYSFVVWAVDGTGNAASGSGSFSISPGPIPAPTDVVAHLIGNETIHVTWAAVTDGTIVGYNVYRATSESGPFTKVTASPVPQSAPRIYVDRSVQPGVTYFYVVTAVDTAGNESSPSSAASARIPGSTPQDGLPWLAIAGVGGAVLAALAAVVVVRRRKR